MCNQIPDEKQRKGIVVVWFGFLLWFWDRVNDDEKGVETGAAVATSTCTWVEQEVESRGMLDPSP